MTTVWAVHAYIIVTAGSMCAHAFHLIPVLACVPTIPLCGGTFLWSTLLWVVMTCGEKDNNRT